MSTSGQAPVSVTMEDRIAKITLNRGARGNALSSELVEALIETLSGLFADGDVHSVVLRGEGRHLCTGFDLGGIETQSDGDLLQRFVRIEMLLNLVWSAPMRTIALATGRTWGAGADLFAACDVRVADPQARFRFPGAGFGLVLGTRRLSVRIGDSAARRWVTTGEEVSAQAALAAGLVTDLLGENESFDDWLRGRAAPTIDMMTLAALNGASRADRADDDLAALVRSAARPGLKDRIISYASQRRG